MSGQAMGGSEENRFEFVEGGQVHANDFAATQPYIPNDKFGLSFGGSRSLSEITPDQMRRFADKARIPASPLWKIAVETAQKTAAGWKSLEQADLLPKDLCASIQKQILRVAATVK
jgi:serine/threonine-protein kinase HipA